MPRGYLSMQTLSYFSGAMLSIIMVVDSPSEIVTLPQTLFISFFSHGALAKMRRTVYCVRLLQCHSEQGLPGWLTH